MRWWICGPLAIVLIFALVLGSATASYGQQPATGPELIHTQPAQPYHLPPDKLAQAVALGKIRLTLHFGEELWELAFLCLLLATGTAARLGDWAVAKTRRGWLQTGIFTTALAALIFLAVDLPLGATGHAFSLHYGISVEAWGPWLLDQAKTLGLSVAFETPLLMLVFGLMQWNWSRRLYWAWFGLFLVPIMVAGTVLLPEIIEPMFSTFTPLTQAHPALVQQLEQVVARTGTSIPPERMFLMQASDKSNGLNAYVTGLGPSKRIVVWDTTADRMPADQILFTFAHESGHYVLNHIPKGLAVGSAGIFVLLGVVAWLAEWLARRWGGMWQIHSLRTLPGLAVLVLAFAVMQIVTEPIQNAASRYIEHEADVYGQEAIHGIVPNPQATAVAAFNTLGMAYLDDPDPSPLVEFWTYDHPSIQTRARFAAQYDPWAPGQKPRFFAK